MRLVVAAMLVSLSLSGCIGDLWDRITAPDADVAISFFDEGWNNDNRFLVIVGYEEPLSIRVHIAGEGELEWSSPATAAVLVDGVWENEFEVEIPDGEWKLTYYVDDHKWNSFDIQIDTVPPEITGLELLGDASDGAYLIGEGATYEGTLQVRDQATKTTIGTSLPIRVSGLSSGIHSYDVIATDQAGNVRQFTVQVRAGDAKFLPSEGNEDFGIIARYTTELALWDLTDMGSYASRSAAAAAQPDYLGSGYGIEPDHPDIQAIVAEEVTPDMSTLQAAWALYEWMFDELEYTEDRLDEDDLLAASDTIQNGGGVCRDLAALYVSLLRAAGVPARLVTGYLAADVNGFHAWVEVYAPSAGQEPWVPVDVSPIDGPFRVTSALGSFGISRPDYLPLAAIPPALEVEGWSSAIRAEFTYNGPKPELSFGKALDIAFLVQRDLCIDIETLARAVNDCQGFTHRQMDFPTRMEQTLDYGLSLDQAADVDAAIAYPTGEAEYVVYGQEWDRDPLYITAQFRSG